MFYGKGFIMSFERNHDVKGSIGIGHSRTAVPVGMVWLIKKTKEPNKSGISARTEEVNEKYIPEILSKLSKGHKEIFKINIFKQYVGLIIISKGGKIIDFRENPDIILSYNEKFYKSQNEL